MKLSAPFKYFVLILLSICDFVLLGQNTLIKGKVVDGITSEPLAYVNILFLKTNMGTVSDENGEYVLESTTPSDSILISLIGYETQKIKIKKNISQILNIKLKPSQINLRGAEVIGSKKDENPAHRILEQIIEHKELNNKKELASYEYEMYNKIQFDISNIKADLFDKAPMKSFGFVKNYIDSSSEKPSLPIFITESMSDFYYRKNPTSKKEFIKAAKISGIQNESVSQFLGDMYQDINIYEDYWILFNQSFTSPISKYALFSYKIYLTDSAIIDNHKCYKLDFYPKRKQEKTFKGYLWVVDSSYSIQYIEAQLASDANVNWVSKFFISQKFKQVNTNKWMIEKEELFVDFQLSKKMTGVSGKKTSTYRNIKVNQEKPNEFYDGMQDITVVDQVYNKDKAYWDQARHEKLTEREKSIYIMIDSIQDVPMYKSAVDIINMFVLGYKVIGPVEIGPYYTLYSYNAIEGNRFKIGGRTSNSFSSNIMLDGYLAYGTKDHKFKYGIGGIGFISKLPRRLLSMHYFKDVEQLGQGLNSWKQDNILASFLRRNPANRLNGYELWHFSIENEWFNGLSSTLHLRKKTIWPLGQLQFYSLSSSGEKIFTQQINTSEIAIETRFAFKEKYYLGQFDRVSLGTKWPIIKFNYTLGIKGLLNGQYNYQRISLTLSDDIHLPPFGYTKVMLEGGKILGQIPYPLLKLHNGNETYSYDNTAFNLMNFYEFVSDQYLNLSVAHHFNGIFLNKIPFLRKLKWREIAQARAAYGSLTSHNHLLTLPATLSSLQKRPYLEAGLGIENLFKVLRIDVIWRMTYIDKDYIQQYESNLNATKIAKWGLRGTLQILF